MGKIELKGYLKRLTNHQDKITNHKEQLKDRLRELIFCQVDKLQHKSVRNLTDDDYRDILEKLHDDKDLHKVLKQVKLWSVSRYSFYGNDRATKKIAALVEYINIDLGHSEKIPLLNESA